MARSSKSQTKVGFELGRLRRMSFTSVINLGNRSSNLSILAVVEFGRSPPSGTRLQTITCCLSLMDERPVVFDLTNFELRTAQGSFNLRKIL